MNTFTVDNTLNLVSTFNNLQYMHHFNNNFPILVYQNDKKTYQSFVLAILQADI